MNKITVPLTSDNKKLFYDSSKLTSIKEELEGFLDGNKYMNSKTFFNNVVFSQEIKSNNTVEGYNDDISLVYNIVNKKMKINDKNRATRINNLYNGYKYISKENEINKETLKELYSILSKDLLSDDDKNNMGEYYRLNDVLIYFSSNLDIEPDHGIDSAKIDSYMDELIDYLNTNNNLDTNTDYFIKSIIAHFQFVNIHPYYDINGRTSRTLSMWYLLNNKVYPYIIFNRAIGLNKNNYYKIIRESKEYKNVTYFLKFLLENVKVELEKEYIIDMIKSNSKQLTAVDYQTIYYILSMNGILTFKDFSKFYNNHNDKKKIINIYNEMVEPLIDKDIIIKVKDTSSYYNSGDKNFIFKLNQNKFENNPEKIKRLILKDK